MYYGLKFVSKREPGRPQRWAPKILAVSPARKGGLKKEAWRESRSPPCPKLTARGRFLKLQWEVEWTSASLESWQGGKKSVQERKTKEEQRRCKTIISWPGRRWRKRERNHIPYEN